MTRDFWNARYSAEGFAYGVKPNCFLAGHAGLLPPGGRVLLPADGEGRNGVYLARQGFAVTSFDQSAVAVEKARALAAQCGASIDARVADAMTFDYASGDFDAVALIFVHLLPPVRKHVHAKAIEALKPGGLILLQAFRSEQLGRASGGPNELSLLYSEPLLRQDFSGCRIELLDCAMEFLDEGPGHQGEGAVVSLVARK